MRINRTMVFVPARMTDVAELLTCLIIFTLLSSSYGTECQASTESLKMVKSCPENETHWKTRANGMKCDSFESTCPPESRLTYHCVLNQWSNGTVEICAPTWYISGYCAMFSLDEKRIKDNFSLDCTKFTKQCPPRYISTDAYKYKSCYEIVNHDETDRKSTKNKPSVSVVSVLIPIAVVVPLLLVIVIGIIIFLRWKKKGSRMRNTEKDKESLKVIEILNESHKITSDTHNLTNDQSDASVGLVKCLPGYDAIVL